MSKLKLKHKLDTGQFMLGTWSQSASPEMLEILGYAGFDFTVIDTEHGYFGLETAENLVRAAEAADIAPIVRVTVNEPHLIMKALDIGADAVVVPQVTTRAEAEKAVSAARYYPKGTRGACPCIRVGQHYITEWDRHATRANAEAMVIALVEGRQGMENIEAIITTDGLDAVMLGPFDLSVALGVGGQLDHPLVMDFMKKVIGLCAARKVHVFIPNFDLDPLKAKEAIAKWSALGGKTFTVGTDKIFFAHHMKSINNTIRGE